MDDEANVSDHPTSVGTQEVGTPQRREQIY